MRLLHDLTSAVRTVFRARFVSAMAIAAFALGIGITTAVFSIFNAVLLTPLPYPDPERIVVVYDTQPACATCPASFPKYMDWKNRNHVFSAIGGSTQASFVMTGNGEPVRVAAMATTASLADVFAVQPFLGRWYSEKEDQAGGPHVVVLTYDLWATRFASNPQVLGRRILFDGAPYEVIGVMPKGFSHRRAEAFVPLQRALDPTTRGNHFLTTYARMRNGVTLAEATAEMRELGRTLAQEFNNNHGIDVRSYLEAQVGSVRTPLRILLGAVFLVLLIACANVTNLLLAAGVARRRELAIRVALGANRNQLIRQLTLETMVLAVSGGAIGVILAGWLVDTFVVLAGNQLPRAASITVDARVVGFAAVVSLGVGLFCGIWPLVLLRSRELATVVREGDTRTGTGAGQRSGNILVIAEIAFTFALLVGACLLIKNLMMLRGRDAGIRTDRIVAFDISPSGERYKSPDQTLVFYRDLYTRMSGVNGIESVGMTSHLPMYNFGWNGEFSIEGGTPWGANEAPLVEYRWISGDYLKTMGIPLLSGRLLDSRDRRDSLTVLINHTMAEKFWPGQDPLGKRFGQDSDHSKWFEVVGVIGDVRSFGLAQKTPYEFYRTIEESPFSALTVVLRTSRDDPTTMIPIARQIVASLDPALPISKVQTMNDVVRESVGQPRLMSALTGLFGSLAGLLAMVGVYGVMAYNVRRQRREFGIRLALGADPGRIRALVLRRGLALASAGIVIGAISARLLSGMLQSVLNDVTSTDPTVFAAAGAAVFLVVLGACYMPARSAGRVDPMLVLRDS